ncbi:hypothetical protein RFI_19817, partial [Reticulomyxa filosa]
NNNNNNNENTLVQTQTVLKNSQSHDEIFPQIGVIKLPKAVTVNEDGEIQIEIEIEMEDPRQKRRLQKEKEEEEEEEGEEEEEEEEEEEDYEEQRQGQESPLKQRQTIQSLETPLSISMKVPLQSPKDDDLPFSLNRDHTNHELSEIRNKTRRATSRSSDSHKVPSFATEMGTPHLSAVPLTGVERRPVSHSDDWDPEDTHGNKYGYHSVMSHSENGAKKNIFLRPSFFFFFMFYVYIHNVHVCMYVCVYRIIFIEAQRK